MKIIKKNQLTILVLALMLVTAGYLNYNNTIETGTKIASIGDATLVSANLSNSIEEQVQNQAIEKNITKELEKEVASSVATTEENAIQTNTQLTVNDDYFMNTKLDRETMYSQMLESYQKILDSKTTSEKQKDAAQVEINNVNKVKNAIMIVENIIKTKGFENVVILVNDDSINVVVRKEELKKEDTAQIQSIVAREMNAKIDDIHIINQ